MALLYEKSALWRAIVSGTRNPRIMLTFVAVTTAGGYAVGKATQMATSTSSEASKQQIENVIKKDKESARYASHSKNALAVMFDSIKPESDDSTDDPNAKYKKNQLKLPGVMWHPKLMEKDKLASAQKEQASTNSRSNA